MFRSAWMLSGAVAVLVASAAGVRSQEVLPQHFPGYMDFQGRFVAVLSDADMVASAYMDNQLGPKAEGMRDELALIPLENGLPGAPRRIPVSNAVTAWPTLLALSADGRFAYVAETDRSPAPGVTSRLELQASPTVRVIDLESGSVIQEIDAVGRAQGLSLSPKGNVLAVNIVDTPRPQFGFFHVGPDGRLSAFRTVDLADTPQTPRDLSWSPDGELLAATFPEEHSARFYRVSQSGEGVAVTPLGGAVITGKLPGVVRWSPDGRHAIVTTLYWGGGADEDYIASQPSTISAIRVDRADGAHRIVSGVAVGASAENFAISPDGRTIVVLNMESSFLAPNSPRLTYHSSLSLLRWDAEREHLSSHGTYLFEGILPEGITFDGSGRFLAVANFAHSNPRRPIEETSIDFWRLVESPAPMLVKMDLSIPVMRGAHVVQVQP